MTEIQNEEKRLTEERAKTLYQHIQETRIVDEASFRLVADYLKHAKQQLNWLDEKFEKSVASAHRAHKDACALRDEALAAFEDAEKLAKDKIANYYQSHSDAPAVDGVTFADRWIVEVTEEGLLPREYMKADLDKLKTVASALKGQCRIPGARVYKVTQVSVRTE